MDLLARLGSRPSIKGIEALLFQELNPCNVYEFFGPEGTGKTEVLLTLTTSIILPKEWKGYNLRGSSAGVIFIDTDYKFQILRLVNIMEKRITSVIEGENENNKESEDGVTADDIENLVKECLKRLIIVRCTSSFQLLVTLHSLESQISNNPDIAAIIIDSISAFYWIDRCNGGENISLQEKNMKCIVQQLTKLVNSYNLILFATKALNFKKNMKENDMKDENCQSLPSKRNFEDHAEYLCKSWHKFVKHRFVFKKVSNSFSVSCSSLNVDTQFVINDSGACFC